MYKSCSRCGKVHDYVYKCHIGRICNSTEKDKFRQTRQWTNKAIEIKKLDKYLCCVCKDNNIYTYDDLETHHIEKLNDRYDLRLENNNLITLCKEHHTKADRGEISKEYLKELIEKQRE